jgi:3-oxoacyl-[acyl-carrier-protein] synthase-3
MKPRPAMRGATVVGWGSALPDKVVTNADLESTLDTTDAWIIERTGIRERRIGGTTAGLAIEAGQRALDKAGLAPNDIDFLLLATTTPDQTIPSTASEVQSTLGLPSAAADLNAACSGFVYGFVTAHAYIGLGYERVLLIGAETLSRVIDWDDRNTAVLFGDGAGAVVLEATDGPGDLLGFDLGSDGSARHILYADVGGYMKMEGREVFRRAVRVLVSSGKTAMERAGVTADDIALVVPHQANIRIIEAASQRLGIPMERSANVLPWTGNTSAASIPLALVDAVENDRLHEDDLVLLVGFGAGMSWAAAVTTWGAAPSRQAGKAAT